MPLLLAVLIGVAAPMSGTRAATAPGVIIVAVEPNGMAERLGLRAGDRIERYGTLVSPSIVAILRAEDGEGRVHAVDLAVKRGNDALRRSMPAGDRGWTLAPDIPPPLRQRVEELLGAVPSAPPDASQIDRLAEDVGASAGDEARLWWHGAIAAAARRASRADLARQHFSALEKESAGTAPFARRAALALALLHAESGDQPAAESAFDRAVEAATDEPAPCRIAVLLARARYDHDKGDIAGGEAHLAQAKALLPETLADTLLGSDVPATECILAWRQAQLERYRSASDRSLAIRARLAPESLDHFRALMAVADLKWGLGQLDAAMADCQHCLAIARRLAPGSTEEARVHTMLGKIDWQRGDVAAARSDFERARELQEKLAPGTLDLAWTYNNLGVIALALGDPREARRRHFDALKIRERTVPGSPSVAYSLLNLGEVLLSQGDTEGAREHLLAALAVAEKLNPEGLDTALCLFGLGQVAQLRDDPHEALRLHQRALAMREKLAPRNLQAVESYRELGWVELALGDASEAMRDFERARDIHERLAPTSPDLALALDGIAAAALEQGDLAHAQRAAEQALAAATADPSGQIAAPVQYRLGLVARRRDRLDEASRRFALAVAALERERFSVGGLTARSYFGGQAAVYHHALIESAVAASDAKGAFEALERARARGAIEVMTESSIDWRPLLPEALRDRIDALRLERKRLSDEVATAATPESTVKLARLEHEQESLIDEVRRVVPSLASIVYPEPLSFEQLGQLLPEGTLLVAYSIGTNESIVLAARRDGAGRIEARGARLALDEAALRKKIELLRGLLADPASGEAWRPASAALADDLLAPIAAWLSTATRMIVMPDGPLHRIPFGVLSPGGRGPLAATLPITIAPSMTLLHSLGHAPHEEPPLAWAGIGDPIYGDRAGAGAGASASRQGRAVPASLPGTREEIERVDALLAGRHRLLLGAEATEQAATMQFGDARVVHFACHTVLNDRFPLRSGLLLSPPRPGETDDGLLQAWEVIDEMRLKAEMVVLSSCETAAGQVRGGEGLMGVGRAFFAAGAKSVVVSHWPIADRSTPELIEAFYRGLAQGLARDVALQRAQGAALADARRSHPYYWAAFELTGRFEPIAGLRPSSSSRWTLAAISTLALVGALALAARGLIRRGARTSN